jgi:hypothetical protein
MVESDFFLMVTLLHSLELLTQYGVKSFYMFFKGVLDNTDGTKSAAQQTKLKNEIAGSSEMSDWVERFREVFDNK